jgi:hypothetical protein
LPTGERFRSRWGEAGMTKLPRIEEALDVFGKRLVVSVEEAA